jgi:hypothetical protein
MDDMREMLDQFAIEKLLKRYARALDEKNFDALDAVFTPDAMLDFGAAGGIRDSYLVVKSWLKEVLDPMPEMQHFTTNVEIEFDGDSATGKSYTFNVNGVRAEGKLQHMNVGAQYFDRFARTPAGWRITERREARLVCFGYMFGPGSHGGN